MRVLLSSFDPPFRDRRAPALSLQDPYEADRMKESQILMEASWLEKLEGEFEKPYMKELAAFLGKEISEGKTVYPPLEKIFNALCQTPFDQTKVVVIGQDPYHGPNQAHGLSFSVPLGEPPPPSLQNIFKELKSDLGLDVPSHGHLEAWAKQGVLLLNATLTVRANEAKSHYGRGWELFTDKIVQILAEREDPIVFLLWGKSAQDKWKLASSGLAQGRHLVLTAPHPSPLSAHAGFFGCRHFSQANEFLEKSKKTPIDWRLL